MEKETSLLKSLFHMASLLLQIKMNLKKIIMIQSSFLLTLSSTESRSRLCWMWYILFVRNESFPRSRTAIIQSALFSIRLRQFQNKCHCFIVFNFTIHRFSIVNGSFLLIQQPNTGKQMKQSNTFSSKLL